MKKLLSFILVAIVFLFMPNTVVSAEDPHNFSLYFNNGILYTDSEYNNEYTGNNNCWAGSGNTLTLNDGFEFKTYAQYALNLPADCNLIINGNVIIGTVYNNGTFQSAIKTLNAVSNDDTLTISGTGTLNLLAPSGNIDKYIDANNLDINCSSLITQSVYAAKNITINGGIVKADYITAGEDINISNCSVLVADDYKNLNYQNNNRGIYAGSDILIDSGETFSFSTKNEAISACGKLTINNSANVVAYTSANSKSAIKATTYELNAPDFASTDANQIDLVAYNANNNDSYNFYCANPYVENNKYYAARLTNDYELGYLFKHMGSGYLNNDIVLNHDVDNEYGDCELENRVNYSFFTDMNLDINLNDHILDLNGKSRISIDCVLLTIDDNGDTVRYFYDDDSDYCYESYSLVKPSGVDNSIETKGGVITGCNNTNYMGGTIKAIGDVNINNCSIVGNMNNQEAAAICGNSGSTINLNNVLIAGNRAAANGGAITTSGAIINFNGGDISYNYAGSNGGAVDSSSGAFHMNGGIIHDNYACYDGGAIFNGQMATSFHMHGGTIENNYAGGSGGGICDIKNDISFDGLCVVKNNKVGHWNDENVIENVYTQGTFTIGMDDEKTLSEGSSIGITKYGGTGVFTRGTYSTASAKYFVSDNSLFAIGIAENNNSELVKQYHISKVDNTVVSINHDNYDLQTALYIMNTFHKFAYPDGTIISYQINGVNYKTIICDNYLWKEDTTTRSLSEIGYVLGTVTNGAYYLVSEDGDCDVDANGNGNAEYYQGETSDTTMHIEGFSLINDDTKPDHLYVKCGGKILTLGTDYVVTDGSLKVTLKNSYVSTLPVGSNVINVDAYKDGFEFSFNLLIKINGKTSTVNSYYKTVKTGID